jgi:dolichol-phosphate mannosyltransferase
MAAAPPPTLVSVVIPVYFNEENIPVTWQALRATLERLPDGHGWEVVFVDDGSGDRSYEALLRVQESEPERVRVVKLTRNFGQVSALLAGISAARGACCVAMSADLQDPPELILDMVGRWNGGERKIVLATRTLREDGLLARWTSRAFYRLMARYAIPNMPEGGFDYFLVDRRVIDLMNQWEEKNTFIQGQILWTGFAPAVVGYTRRKREIGRSRWTVGRKIKYFLDGFVTYTVAPITGWAPLMITILFLGGLQLVLLGVIGEYLWRSYHETRKQPNFVIESVVGGCEGRGTKCEDREQDAFTTEAQISQRRE